NGQDKRVIGSREVLNPQNKWSEPELDRNRKEIIKCDEKRHLQQQWQASAQRVDTVFLVEIHQFSIHLLPIWVRGLELLRRLLTGLHLRLQLLHFLSGDDRFIAQRKQRQIDQNCQKHDGQTVVPAE